MVTNRDIYFFDLNGFLFLEGVLSREEVSAMNECVEAVLPLDPGEWRGYINAHDYGTKDGLNLQQIYEAGAPFETLIDHPSWIDKVKYFVGGEGTFDWSLGPLFIDENFVNIRGPGQAIGLHSGGHVGVSRTQFRVLNGKFHCNQINILMALTDIGPGDGATMLIPGSHKSNFAHPDYDEFVMSEEGSSMDTMEGAVEIHMRAGDALLFVDACSHGSAKRENPGERRIAVYRYGPSWGNHRHPYQPSPELLARLTPDRRQIVRPREKLERSPNRALDFRGTNPGNG